MRERRGDRTGDGRDLDRLRLVPDRRQKPDPIAIKLGIGDFSTARDFPTGRLRAGSRGIGRWPGRRRWRSGAVTSAWRSAAFTNEVADSLSAER
jgi:hypothetical protein